MKNSWWKIAVVMILIAAVTVVVAGKNKGPEKSTPVASVKTETPSVEVESTVVEKSPVEQPKPATDVSAKPDVAAPAVKPSEESKPTPAPIVDAKKPVVAKPKPKPAEKKEAKLPKIIDLGAKKCIPCKMMTPVLEDLSKDYKGKLDVVFIDVWENREESEKYGVQSIPTQIFYDESGKEIFRHEGFFAKEDILKTFKSHGIELE